MCYRLTMDVSDDCKLFGSLDALDINVPSAMARNYLPHHGIEITIDYVYHSSSHARSEITWNDDFTILIKFSKTMLNISTTVYPQWR